MNKPLDQDVWLPNLWFFLRTIAHSYPDHPSTTTKRKYYDFVQNLPLFIPHPEFGNKFSGLLDSFPVQPYLANRDSFFYWIHYMENRVNRLLGKPESTYFQHQNKYYSHYAPQTVTIAKRFNLQKKYIFMALILLSLFFVVYLEYSKG